MNAEAVQLAMPTNTLDVGELRVYQMVFPFLPPSKNDYDRWLPAWQSACKRKWVKRIGVALDENMVPRGVPKIGLAAQLVFPTSRCRDLQNYAQCLWHFVPDALVRHGVISDDRDGKIEFGPQLGVSFAYDERAALARRQRERTILAITMQVPPGWSP